MNFKSPKYFLYYSSLTIVVVFLAGLFVGKNEYFSIVKMRDATPAWLMNAARSAQVNYILATQGEQAVISARLNIQNTPSNFREKKIKILESSVLPLNLEFIPLSIDGKFPAAAGAITSIEGSVVIMDRLGGFYRYHKGDITKIISPKIPNNINKFILESDAPLSSDTLRTHSIAYSKNHRKIFVSYERYLPSTKSYKFVISTASFDAISFSINGAWSDVFLGETRNTINGQSGGGKLLTQNDLLYFSIGDYGPYEDAKAYDLTSSFGKIYKYDLNSHAVKMLSYGHRNTQGLVFTDKNELINVEQGPQGGDEINIIIEGANYGWPYVTDGTDYGSYKWSLRKNIDKLAPKRALFSWVPSIAADTIIQIGAFHANWRSDLLVGSLKSQSLYRIKYNENRVIFVEPIWIGHRIRDLLEFDGFLYLYTDDALLIKIRPDEIRYKNDLKSSLAGYYQDANLAKCVMCHHFGETTPTHTAPSLSGLIGRDIGSDGIFAYSSALKSKKSKWDKENLTNYLRNPALFAPGTTMPNPGLSDSEINKIIDKLSKT
jgi:cytochrome c2